MSLNILFLASFLFFSFLFCFSCCDVLPFFLAPCIVFCTFPCIRKHTTNLYIIIEGTYKLFGQNGLNILLIDDILFLRGAPFVRIGMLLDHEELGDTLARLQYPICIHENIRT